MPGEKRKRKHSRHVQSPDSAHDGTPVKKRKKDKSGKTKRKRKHDTHQLKEAVEQLDTHDAQKKQEKKRKKRSKSKSDDAVETSPNLSPEKPSRESLSDGNEPMSNVAVVDGHVGMVDGEVKHDAKAHTKEKRKKKKKKKERQNLELNGEEPHVKPTEYPEQPHKPPQKAAVAVTREHEHTDKPDANEMIVTSLSGKSAPSSNPIHPAPAEGSAGAAEPSGAREDDDSPLDDKRLPRTLFVGNVPQTTNQKQLAKLFSEYAPIESVRIRNVIPVNPKIPKKAALLAGRLAKFSDSFSAYVVFKPTENVEEVLQGAIDGTNMTIFQDHHLRVTRALQKKGRKRQSVFVGNLPFDCTDEELIKAFMPVAKECGVKLMNVRVNRDTDTGVGRGVGFATFDDIIGVQAAINKAGEIKIRGRPIRIQRAFKTMNMKSKSYKRKRNTAFGRYQS